MTVEILFEFHSTSTDNEAGVASGWRDPEHCSGLVRWRDPVVRRAREREPPGHRSVRPG